MALDQERRLLARRRRVVGVRRLVVEGIGGGAGAARIGDEFGLREIGREIGAKRGRRLDDGRRAARGIDADDRRRRLRCAGTADDRAIDGIDEPAILKRRREPPQGATLADDAERPDAVLVDGAGDLAMAYEGIERNAEIPQRCGEFRCHRQHRRRARIGEPV